MKEECILEPLLHPSNFGRLCTFYFDLAFTECIIVYHLLIQLLYLTETMYCIKFVDVIPI